MRFRNPISKDVEQVKQAMYTTGDLGERMRLQCIVLGDTYLWMSEAEIGGVVGFSESYVRRLFRKFREIGFDSIEDKRGGRHHAYMSFEQEAHLLAQLDQQMRSGQLCVVAQVKRIYEQAVGHKVCNSMIYRLLTRHGYRKIVPYKRHPRQNQEQKEEYKKNSIRS